MKPSPAVDRSPPPSLLVKNSTPVSQPVTRRWFLRDCGVGLGKIAAAGLLTDSFTSRLLATPAHFPGKAKAVIHLFMAGAPSQLDLFDNKPELAKLEGKPLPPSVIGGQRYAFIRPDAAVLGPQFKFAKHGQSGAELSEALPHLAKIVDDICLIRSSTPTSSTTPPPRSSSTPASPARPAEHRLLGHLRPRLRDQRPARLRRHAPAPASAAAAANWSSGFLPTYTGVRFRNQGDPILNVSSPGHRRPTPARHPRPVGNPEPPATRRRRRPRDRHPHRQPTKWPSASRPPRPN
jgi:hypothetical protein